MSRLLSVPRLPGEFAQVRTRVEERLSTRAAMIVLTVLPAAALFAFIKLIPILWAFWASLFDIPLFSPEWAWAGGANYQSVLADGEFWDAMGRSTVFAAGSILLQLTVGTGLALLINRSFPLNRVIRTLIIIPYLIPTAVLGFMGLWMGNDQWGIVNWLLVEAGLITEFIAWYGDLDLVMLSVILTSSWKFTIFVTVMVLARLQGIPNELYEVAAVTGATTYQRFRDITLPHLKGVIFIVVLLRGVWMFNKFDIIWILTNGGPREATTTAPIYAFKVAFVSYSLGEGAAVSVVLFLILVAVAIVYFNVLEPEAEVRVE